MNTAPHLYLQPPMLVPYLYTLPPTGHLDLPSDPSNSTISTGSPSQNTYSFSQSPSFCQWFSIAKNQAENFQQGLFDFSLPLLPPPQASVSRSQRSPAGNTHLYSPSAFFLPHLIQVSSSLTWLLERASSLGSLLSFSISLIYRLSQHIHPPAAQT